MGNPEGAAVQQAKAHIASVIRALRECNGSYTDLLQKLLDGMDSHFATKENLFKIGEMCDPKILGDQFVDGYTSQQWLKKISLLHDYCARAFNELERMSA